MEINLDKIKELWPALAVSLGAVVLYGVIWSGQFRSWYVIVPLPGLLGPAMFYALPTLGLAFTMLLLSAVFPVPDPTRCNIWWVLFLALEGISLLLMIRPPPWIKPGWVRWLEREYGYCLDILIDEARRMNRWEWEGRVRTQAGMEAWIDEVYVQRRKEINKRWEQVRGRLLYEQARKKGRHWIGWGEEIEGFVPAHRREEEKERARRERKRAKRRRQRVHSLSGIRSASALK